MNKRIKELYRQAHSIRHHDGDPTLEGNPPTVYWQGEVSAQRFAELIVRECVRTLIDNTPERYTNESAEEDWDKGYDRAMTDCVHHIQEHFGVE
jgi:hypothetical protein